MKQAPPAWTAGPPAAYSQAASRPSARLSVVIWLGVSGVAASGRTSARARRWSHGGSIDGQV